MMTARCQRRALRDKLQRSTLTLAFLNCRISDTNNREEIRKVFRLFDDDDSGTIQYSDLQRVAKELGETMTEVCIVFCLQLPRVPLSHGSRSQAELKEMIDRADTNKDGVISFDEFFNVMTKVCRLLFALPWTCC